ncbi:MAG TPA: nitroreductase family deazaflavin-dependent oxidoreductase [Anaerolineales bacterium]|nr:nitroreductase family deazaflavin-dependent oxidoreductase [Anaerolineales bacterium]
MTKTNNSALVYQRPPWVMRHLFDPLTLLLVGKLGMDDRNGTRVLEVKGRKSGIWRATPVRLLELNGHRYLVAMYGETNWVKNLRSQGEGRLRIGSHMDAFRAVELDGNEKLNALRAYLKLHWNLVAQMTTVKSPDAPEEELMKAGRYHPVFRLE